MISIQFFSSLTIIPSYVKHTFFKYYKQIYKTINKQAIAEEIFLRYLQRWGKDFLRRRLDWTIEETSVRTAPRHLSQAMCPCQYAEEIIINKPPKKDTRKCCATCTNWCSARGFNLC